jgi:putative SOS response-associated peptidase YedK
MCGRFAQYSDPDAIAEHFELETNLEPQPRYNVAPTQPILAVRAAADARRRELVRLRWGLVPFWSKGPDNRYSMINARAETVATKPAYRAAFAKRRCLIPADAFYEWRAGGRPKTPFAIRRRDHALFAMAGLWEHWHDDAGNAIDSCSIIVTDANPLLKPIHDRMPVILQPEHYRTWLDPHTAADDQLRALLKPAEPDGWEAYPVSTAVNRPTNDAADLLSPLADQ